MSRMGQFRGKRDVSETLSAREPTKRKSPIPSDRQGYGPRSQYGHLDRAINDLLAAAHVAYSSASDEERAAVWTVVRRKQRAIIQRVRRMLNAKGPV